MFKKKEITWIILHLEIIHTHTHMFVEGPKKEYILK